jgi:DNA modification methylase
MNVNNANTYKGIYAMHKYWGKKPFDEISRFVEKYSCKNDVVLDCFCGSGVTLVEAAKLKRNGVGLDINPISVKLSKVLTTPVNSDSFAESFQKIKTSLEKTINSLYEVNFDGDSYVTTHTIWEKENPTEVWYMRGKKKEVRQAQKLDKDMAISPAIEPKWFPQTIMFENSRINVDNQQKVTDMFTPRAIVALSLIFDEIKKIEDSTIRNLMEITFTGTLSQASKLVFVIRNRNKNGEDSTKCEVGSWVIGYWKPKEHFEINVWNCFENRYKRVSKGVVEINALFTNLSRQRDGVTTKILKASATEMPLKDNSIDYVFIDPPHTNRILYLEMSLMWNSWLGLDNQVKWEDEIVVSEAKQRNKKLNNYNELLGKSFAEIRRVLKPNKYISVVFNCLDDDAWQSLFAMLTGLGFTFVGISPLKYSATSVVQDNRKNALKTDFVITFKNTDNSIREKITVLNNDNLIEEKVKKILKDNPRIEVFEIINKLFEETLANRCLFKVSKIVRTVSNLKI